MKFVVIKGMNWTPGSQGLKYEFFDFVDFDDSLSITDQMRKYTWRNLYDVDCRKNPSSFKDDVGQRQRHLNIINDDIFTAATIFDYYPTGLYYGFIPLEDIINANYKK